MSGQGSGGNVLAALCSLFIPGLGQLLQGRLLRAIMGLLNISLTWPINALDEIDSRSRREWSKKSVQQGRSQFGARSVLTVREHGKLARTPLAAFFNIPSHALS